MSGKCYWVPNRCYAHTVCLSTTSPLSDHPVLSHLFSLFCSHCARPHLAAQIPCFSPHRNEQCAVIRHAMDFVLNVSSPITVVDTILIEFAPQLLMSNGVDPAAMLHWLSDVGYTCFDCPQEFCARPGDARLTNKSITKEMPEWYDCSTSRNTGQSSRQFWMFETTFWSFAFGGGGDDVRKMKEHGEWTDLVCV